MGFPAGRQQATGRLRTGHVRVGRGWTPLARADSLIGTSGAP
jgi:hypothetical protein